MKKKIKQLKKAQGKSSNSKSITTDGKVTSPEFLKNAKTKTLNHLLTIQQRHLKNRCF